MGQVRGLKISIFCVIVHNMPIKIVEDGDVIEEDDIVMTELLEEDIELETTNDTVNGVEDVNRASESGEPGALGEFEMNEEERIMVQEHDMTRKIPFKSFRADIIDNFVK